MGTVPSSFEGEGEEREAELRAPAWAGTPSAARCRPHRKEWHRQTAPGHALAPAVAPALSLAYPRGESPAESAAQRRATEGREAREAARNGGAESAPSLLLLLGEPGFEWTQYGTKPIAGGQRLYQKCRVPGCGVKKIVEVLDEAADGSGGGRNKEKFDGEHSHGPATITLKVESTESLKELVWRASRSSEEAKDEEPVGIKTVFMECSAGTDIFDDGFSWRKYGEKKVKGCKYKRSYYRCSSHKQCPARKTVEHLDEGKRRVTYKDSHSHACPAGPPPSLASPRGALLVMPSTTAATAAEEAPPGPPPLQTGEDRLLASQPHATLDGLGSLQQRQPPEGRLPPGQGQGQAQQQQLEQRVDGSDERQLLHEAGQLLCHSAEEAQAYREPVAMQGGGPDPYAGQELGGTGATEHGRAERQAPSPAMDLEEEQVRLAFAEPLMQAPVQAYHIVEDGDHNMLFVAGLNYDGDEEMDPEGVINSGHKRKRLQEATLAKRRRAGLT